MTRAPPHGEQASPELVDTSSYQLTEDGGEQGNQRAAQRTALQTLKLSSGNYSRPTRFLTLAARPPA